MKTHRSLFLMVLLLAAAASMACAVFGQEVVAPTPEANQVQPQPAEGQPTEAVVQNVPAVAEDTRGPGDFELLDPAVGLDGLDEYQSSLELSFEGTRDGAPYTLKQTFEQAVSRPITGRSLAQTSVAADGAVTTWSSWLYGQLRYVQAGPDQPCQVGVLETSDKAPFEPAGMLPVLRGAVAAGEETVNDVPARVYTFDALALNAGADSQASGKLWLAVEGGWVVKYELSLRSERLFGEGISGEQRWLYQVSRVGQPSFGLPDACPQGTVDLPTPDDAQISANLPNLLKFTSAKSPADLAGFYSDTLANNFWTAQGEPAEADNGVRLVFSRAVQDKEQMAFIILQPVDGGSAVTIYEILTDPVVGKEP